MSWFCYRITDCWVLTQVVVFLIFRTFLRFEICTIRLKIGRFRRWNGRDLNKANDKSHDKSLQSYHWIFRVFRHDFVFFVIWYFILTLYAILKMAFKSRLTLFCHMWIRKSRYCPLDFNRTASAFTNHGRRTTLRYVLVHPLSLF